MKVLSFKEYLELEFIPSNAFGNNSFLRLNAPLAEEVIAIVSDKSNLGITFGVHDGVVRSPWSAPYLAIGSNGQISDNELDTFSLELCDWLKDKSYRLVFPPAAYNGLENRVFESISKYIDVRKPNQALYRVYKDTSFHIPLGERELPAEKFNRNSRRNLAKAIESGLKLRSAESPRECYDLIASHHGSHDYKMAMTWEQVADTSEVIPIDFWLVYAGDKAVSAAYCYRVRKDIVQVINSGATSDGMEMGAMTFMAYALTEYYRNELVVNQGITNALLDYGPTSVEGVQNDGLWRFKTGLGMIETSKYTICHK